MNLRRNRLAGIGSTLLAAAALTLVATPTASSAPNPTFRVSSIPAGVTSGGELAIDTGRNKLFITDNDFVLATTGGTNVQINPKKVDPKVTIFGLRAQRPVGAISYIGQPWGVMPFGPVPVVPTPQVPDGIGLDTTHGRVVSTASHANGITIVDMNATTTSAANLISLPLAHPMGVAVNGAASRAYVALNSKNAVTIIDTGTRRQVGEIPGIYAPSFMALDNSRHRLYVGNADYMAKKTNYVAVVDTRTNAVIKKIPTPSNSRPAVDPATGRVFAASFDTGKISVIDPNSLTVVNTIATGTSPNKVAIDGQRRLVYTSNLQKRTITVIDADTQRVLTTVPVGVPVHTIVVDPKTGTVYGTQHQLGKLTVLTVTGR
ncbi:YncE family protein [Gordonia sp. NPDC003424]